MNLVVLIGHLTKDPQVKYLSSNTAVCECGIAVSDKWKDKDGNKQERTCFIDFAIFGKSGENFNQYAVKGRAVMLRGKLKLDNWTDKESGQKRYKHTIVVDDWQLLGDPRGEQKPQAAAASKPRSTNELYEQAQAAGDDLGLPF